MLKLHKLISTPRSPVKTTSGNDGNAVAGVITKYGENKTSDKYDARGDLMHGIRGEKTIPLPGISRAVQTNTRALHRDQYSTLAQIPGSHVDTPSRASTLSTSDSDSFLSDSRYKCIYEGTRNDERLARIRTKIFRGHKKEVTSCDFISQELIISGSADESVLIWDTSCGNIMKHFDGAHQCKVTCVRISPDANCLATTGWDKKIRLWDIETTKLMWTGTHVGLVTSCAFSHDGGRIATCTDRENDVIIWSVETGEIITKLTGLHSSTVSSVQFTYTGDRLLTTSYDRIAVISDLLSKTVTAKLKGHTNVISDAAITRDNRWVATVSWDKCILLFDITTGMYREKGGRIIEKAHEGCISCCEFNEDGTMLVTGGYDLRVCVWDVDQLTRIHKLQGHTDWVTDVKFSPDAKFILSSAKDKHLRLWDISADVPVFVDPEIVAKQKAFKEKLADCEDCGKPFSLTHEHQRQGVKNCVICRLAAGPTDYTKDFEDLLISFYDA